jgi:hypothetical protein
VAFSTQGLSGGDAQLLETFTRSIFPISDLFALNQKLGIFIKNELNRDCERERSTHNNSCCRRC